MSGTPVIFRRYPDGEVIALFPTLLGGRYGECVDYLHFGQHGSADYNRVIQLTRPAEPEEYANLRAELVAVGYADLRVYQREQPWMHRERIDAYVRMTEGGVPGGRHRE